MKKMSNFVVRKMVKKQVKWRVLLTKKSSCDILKIVIQTRDKSHQQKGDGYYVTRSNL